MPKDKLESLLLGLEHFETRGMRYGRRPTVVRPDFPQPEMYRKLFKRWGLDVMP